MSVNRIEEIKWTSPDEVCEELARFVRITARPAHRGRLSDRLYSIRFAAIKLLASLASSRDIPALRVILLDRRECERSRQDALRGLARLGALLSAEEVGQLLQAPEFWWFHPEGWWSVSEQPPLYHLYLLSPPSKGELIFRDFLAQAKPVERTLALSSFLQWGQNRASELTEWLYRRWLEEDRISTEATDLLNGCWVYHGTRSIHPNVRIISLTRGRPETEALLPEYRSWHPDRLTCFNRAGRRPGQEDEELLPPELWTDETEMLEAVTAAPEEFAGRVATFDLPYRALLQYFDPETLGAQIEQEIRSASRIHRAQEEAQAEEGYFHSTRLRRALELLLAAPDDRLEQTLTNLYLCPDMHRHLRSQLYDLLWERGWKREPEQMKQGVLGWAAQPPELTLRGLSRMGKALVELSRRPEAASRPFFLWALEREEKAEFRYLALRSLEAIGEDGEEWRARLRLLADDPDDMVRLEACAALFRRGEKSQEEAIARIAAWSNSGFARAEGLRWLGEHDGPAYLRLFAQTLFSCRDPDYGSCGAWDFDWPHATEAALQLARLGTLDALTELLRACLTSQWLADEIRLKYLPPRAELPARESRHDQTSDEWRWQFPWEWRCC